MKKIIAAAAGLALVGTMATAASAVESQFGGYNRNRAFTQIDFDGQDSGSFARTDMRTRLYYTAVFNENFSFVNKFEFNSVYGDDEGGDIGADGDTFRVKNSYVDFTTGMARFKVGIQGATIARGFAFADDGSGIYAGVNAGDMALLQFLWLKVEEKEVLTDEIDIYGFIPVISVGDALSVTPNVVYANVEGSDDDVWWLGADVDYAADNFSLWFTGLYQGGEEGDGARDISAFLLAAGGSVGMFHGEIFYATGDDDGRDADQDAFTGAPGQSYYWSEIMGLGIFDNAASAGSPDDNITNIIAANVGVKTKVAEKLTIGGDLWYAMLAEDDANGEDDLGIEVDLKATYAIMDNLNLDLVAAYLFAGDATGGGDEDPIEVGARLSLSF
jgi:hypothetical protein